MRDTYQLTFLLGSLAVLIALPWVLQALDSAYLISTASRLVIFAIAAVSLDLLIGYTGLVSFGHAAFLGVGAYTVGILSFHAYDETTIFGLPGTLSGLIALPLAAVLSAYMILARKVLVCSSLAWPSSKLRYSMTKCSHRPPRRLQLYRKWG